MEGVESAGADIFALESTGIGADIHALNLPPFSTEPKKKSAEKISKRSNPSASKSDPELFPHRFKDVFPRETPPCYGKGKRYFRLLPLILPLSPISMYIHIFFLL
jgi:hypothetical protein